MVHSPEPHFMFPLSQRTVISNHRTEYVITWEPAVCVMLCAHLWLSQNQFWRAESSMPLTAAQHQTVSQKDLPTYTSPYTTLEAVFKYFHFFNGRIAWGRNTPQLIQTAGSLWSGSTSDDHHTSSANADTANWKTDGLVKLMTFLLSHRCNAGLQSRMGSRS